MDIDVSQASLSDAFGFAVSEGFAIAIQAAVARSPQAPHLGFEKFGLELGGPLYSLLGGDSAQSLRCSRVPPEFFPFAVRRAKPDIYVGFLVDAPSLEGEVNTTYAVCVPEHPERCGVVARDEQELFRWLGAHLQCLDKLGVSLSSNSYKPEEVKLLRDRLVRYKTADRFGVVVPEENTPLSLLHEDMRSLLIEKRDIGRVREVGYSALRLGAPGAALALARDLSWWLGHREHWYQLANELYESAYTHLGRPLLNRIVRREWVRLYGRPS